MANNGLTREEMEAANASWEPFVRNVRPSTAARSAAVAARAAVARAAAGGVAAAPPSAASVRAAREASIASIGAGAELLGILREFSIPSYNIQPMVRFGVTETSFPNVDHPGTLQELVDEFRGGRMRPTEGTGVTINDTNAHFFSISQEGRSASVTFRPSGYDFDPRVRPSAIIENPNDTNNILYFVVLAPRGHLSLMVFAGGIMYSLGVGLMGIAAGSTGRRANTGLPRLRATGAAAVSALGAAGGVGPIGPGAAASAAGLAGSAATAGRPVATNAPGLGTIDQAALYLPDFLITPEAVSRRGPHQYYIVDVGILKRKHLERIRNLTLAHPAGDFIAELVYSDATGKYHYNTITMPLNKTYSLYSAVALVDRTADFMNCTSFLETVFKERFNCGDERTGRLVTNPHRCRSFSGLGQPNEASPEMNAFIKQVLSEYFLGDAYTDQTANTLTREKDVRSIGTWAYNCTLGKCFPRGEAGGGGRRTKRAKKYRSKARKTKHRRSQKK